jgi:hypothetical protein
MEPAKISYKIYQGSTFEETLRWESETSKYAEISAITKAAPCVITTTAAHSIPLNWRVRVTGVGGMKEINNLDEESYYLVTAKTSNSITLNQVNSANYSTYTSGGIVTWNLPVPINDYTARMQIRETIDSTDVIADLTSANGGINIDPINSTISLYIPAITTANYNFETAVYGCNLIDIQGHVTPFLRGSVTLVKEIVR